MTEKELEKLKSVLQKRDVSLADFLSFLQYHFNSSLPKLHHYLTQQKIDLNSFQNYLKENTPPAKVPLSITKSKEVSKIEQIGIQLLSSARTPIAELNSVLEELPTTKLSPRYFLQLLLKNRKITIEEFFELETLNYETSSSVDFHLKEKGEHFEFCIGTGEKTFGHYQILEELGRGGMGVVYKAYHPQLNQTFALKVLIAGEGASEKVLKRFQREAKLMAKLSHPYILQILDSGQEGKQYYFAMEFVEGKTFGEAMKQKEFLRKGLLFLKKTLEALDYAHQQNIIHRDLKPENLLVTKQGAPKIADFGLAKETSLTKESQKLTHSGAILGTLLYMSPEQARGETKNIDSRTDLYSIGVCLYELLTGRPPFRANSSNNLLYKIINEEAVSPRKFKKELHQDLATIALKALEKSPNRRYQSAREFSDDLACFLDGHPIQTKSGSISEKIFKWKKRNQQTFRLSLVSIIAILFFIGWFQWSKWNIKKQNFTISYQKGIAAFKSSNNMKAEGFAAVGRKMKLLLEALHTMNTALSYYPKDKKTEQKKWEIGSTLVELACNNQAFDFAHYVTSEMQQLSSVSQTEKNSLKAKINTKKSKILTQHMDYLARSETLLKTKILSKKACDDIVFNIAKMNESEVFAHLMKDLKESFSYFCETNTKEKLLTQYYLTKITALGRLGKAKAGQELWDSLKKMSDSLSKRPPKERELLQIEYMVVLARAIGCLKLPKIALPMQNLRLKMGSQKLFWNRTRSVHRKLLVNDKLHLQEVTTAADYYQRGSVRFDLKDLQGALADFTESIRLDPKVPNPYNSRGNIRAYFGDNKGALEDYTKAIELKPANANAYCNRGLVFATLGNFEKAIQDYTKAIELKPEERWSYYNNRGLAKLSQEKFDAAIEDFNTAILCNPQDIGGYNNRGLTYSDKKEYQKAIADFTKAIELAPQYATSYLNRGGVYTKINQFDLALIDFTEAIRLNPQFSEAYQNRGEIKRMKKDNKGAIQDFDEAIRLKTKYSRAYLNRAYAKNTLQLREEALLDFNMVLKEEPESIEAYLARGSLKQQLKDFKGAVQDFSKAIELDSKNVQAYYNRGNARQLLKDFKGALKDWTTTTKIQPDFANGYKNIGIAHFQKGAFKKAIQQWDKALAIEPTDLTILFYRASAKLERQDLDGTIEDCTKIIRLDPKMYRSYYYRGVAWQQKGDMVKAQIDFRQYLLITKRKSDPEILQIKKFILNVFPNLGR